jgi:hypothetical protein
MQEGKMFAADGCVKPNIRTIDFVVTAQQPCEHWKVREVSFTIAGESEESTLAFVQKWLMTGPMHKMVITGIRRA